MQNMIPTFLVPFAILTLCNIIGVYRSKKAQMLDRVSNEIPSSYDGFFRLEIGAFAISIGIAWLAYLIQTSI